MPVAAPYFPTRTFRKSVAVQHRPANSANKTTAQCKHALQAAFMELGGVDGLVRYGRENPGEFYKLWSKLIPAEMVEHKQGDTIKVLVYAPAGTERETAPTVIEASPSNTSIRNTSVPEAD